MQLEKLVCDNNPDRSTTSTNTCGWSEVSLGVQEDWAGVGEKAGGACGGRRGRGEDTSLETAQTHGPYQLFTPELTPTPETKYQGIHDTVPGRKGVLAQGKPAMKPAKPK